jgi:uncharacterized protein (TIGR02145 family)
MCLFNRLGRALLAVVGLVGCSKKSGQEAAQKSPDALPITFYTFTDTRDGNVYRTVRIGNQVWMAENLRYNIEDSWCYDEDEANGQKYGRLYAWDAAKKACPAGWHLPSREEWDALAEKVGGEREIYYEGLQIWYNAGKRLKSKSDWNDYNGVSSGNGTDDYCFSALPVGLRSSGGFCFGTGNLGHWWTSTQYSAGYAYYKIIHYENDSVCECYDYKRYARSVRCVKD